VIKIVEQDGENSVSRELALIKVRADAGTRSQVIEAVNLFRAKVVDVSTESLTIEATGTPEKIEALLRVLEPGIRRSCSLVAGRGRVSRWHAWTAGHRDHQITTPRCRLCLADNVQPPRSAPNKEIRKRQVAVEMFYDDDADLSIIQAARSASSATAARATRTRSRCATPAST
jgi:hypothetical protein